MEKPIKPCEICQGECLVVELDQPGKKYRVVCSSCGNESELKRTRNAAINAHNKTVYRVHKVFSV